MRRLPLFLAAVMLAVGFSPGRAAASPVLFNSPATLVTTLQQAGIYGWQDICTRTTSTSGGTSIIWTGPETCLVRPFGMGYNPRFRVDVAVKYPAMDGVWHAQMTPCVTFDDHDGANWCLRSTGASVPFGYYHVAPMWGGGTWCVGLSADVTFRDYWSVTFRGGALSAVNAGWGCS